ncbi:MAG: terpene cyclase/mutase family protein [Anaerolineales bacterium]|nr:terpene cyclase/mutase family protein [Anaerolineales bacterium]
MTPEWLAALKGDPLPLLLEWPDPALTCHARHDLLEEAAPPVETLWEMPAAARLFSKQQPDGSWRYPGKSSDSGSGENYNLLETYRTLRVLVEMYGLQRSHPALGRAAEFVFGCQTDEGDIRGILGSQYMPYYHGAILELLIKAGFDQDVRLEGGLTWLLAVRQADGGWVVPAQTVPAKQKTSPFWLGAPFKADSSRPSSHLATGMALRAFAAHPAYHRHPAVLEAAHLLKSRLFQADRYNDRKHPSYWLKLQFPFWWTTLLTALDTLSRLGFAREDPQIAGGLDWFLSNQSPDGLWETGYDSGPRAESNRRWVGLAVCRVLKHCFG